MTPRPVPQSPAATGLDRSARLAAASSRGEQVERHLAWVWISAMAASLTALFATFVAAFVAIANFSSAWSPEPEVVVQVEPAADEGASRVAVIDKSADGTTLTLRMWDGTRRAYIMKVQAEHRDSEMVAWRGSGHDMFSWPPLPLPALATVERYGDTFVMKRHDGAVRQLVWTEFEEACPDGRTMENFRLCHKDHPDRCATAPATGVCHQGEVSVVELSLIGDTVWVVAERPGVFGRTARMLAGVAFHVDD